MSVARNLQLLHAVRWEEGPLGPLQEWAPEMRGVVDAMLHTAFPVCTVWGPRRIQIYNDAYVPIYGDKHPAAFGAPMERSWSEIWEFLAPAIDRVWETQQPLWFKQTLLPLARQQRPEECWFDFSYSPILDRDGRTLGVMSIAADITAQTVFQRRQASLAAGRLERDAAEPLLAVQSTLSRMLAGNEMDAALAVLYQADAATGLPCTPLWRLRCSPGADAPLRTRRAVAPTAAVTRFARAEALADAALADYGHWVTVRSRSGRIAAHLGIVPHPLVPEASHHEFAVQLANRLHADLHALELHLDQVGGLRRDLEESEALHRFLFDHMEEAAIYTATDGDAESDEYILAANGQACQLLGYAAQELVGMRREAFFFPEDPELRRALAVRQHERSFRGDLVFRRKDGSAVPVEISSRLVRLSTGETRSVSIVREIVQRLAREKRAAERARIEGIAQLTGGIAHDFNNLLTVVLGSLDTLAEHLPRASPEQQLVATATLGAEQAAALTSALLSYAKQQMLHLQEVDPAAHLARIQGLLQSTAGEANVLHLATDADLPACWLDAGQLTSALLNLVANARDAMPGGGTIVLRCSHRTEAVERQAPDGHDLPPGDYLVFTVEDSGPGIPAEVLPRVFEPFFSTKVDAGHGLGLPMVQGFARQCGGEALIETSPGQGTRVEVLLPVSAQPPGTTTAAIRPGPSSA